MNRTLKFIIIGSLTILLVASAGIGVYVWKYGNQKVETPPVTSTKDVKKAPVQVELNEVKKVDAGSDITAEDGSVDPVKLLKNAR